MLISRNWLREFVDLPAGLDPRELAERFTITTAEIEGIEHVTRLPDGVRFPPGAPLDPAERDDWIIEIDNKSITHRPDLWGHYGIAREIAAMLGTPLRPYPITPADQLGDPASPAIPIVIDDPQRCPRYTAVLMTGLKAQPSPPWMQVRLARCGMRPIDLLVDLTNYVMLELGQPMHAFDGGHVSGIEVAVAAPGERFRTLDAVERVMPAGALMIQSGRKSVAIAGIMGGAETEVSPGTTAVLLESANFEAAGIRRTAAALSLRTEASARFEKSLDPANTVIGVARFVHLARRELPGLRFASRLSDCYPRPLEIRPIEVDTDFAARFIGADVPPQRMSGILESLEFRVEPRGRKLLVTPPSFRATKDIAIEADVIEEISRVVGYQNIEPALPTVTTRYFGQAADLRLERRTLDFLCIGGPFVECHGYIWYDDEWLATLGWEPGECLTLHNPAAAACSRMRRTLVPGLLRIVERNRHHFAAFQLVELGSVFYAGRPEVETSQERHLGLVVAQSGAKSSDDVLRSAKQAIEGWALQLFDTAVRYGEAGPQYPWEDEVRTSAIHVAGSAVGRLSPVALACRQRIDERLRSWAIAIAELSLTPLSGLLGRSDRLPRVSEHPCVRLDFSFLADARRRYAQIESDIAAFSHPLLRRMTYVGSFEGGAVPAGKRSFTIRAEIGADDHTLAEQESQEFRTQFTAFLQRLGLELRS
ncbi:MAG: phenylalanine--tRNA ligase subunit beta [Phycisphaerae bacterium]|nr:phenylalanine--tRNA ligase subunit beta [Phycisphaerae bacterium]